MYLGLTSLIYATTSGDLDVVRVLVESGADVNSKKNDGKLVYIYYVLKFYLCKSNITIIIFIIIN